LFILNAAAVITWEFLAAKNRVSLQYRWFPRIVSLAAITVITINMIFLLYATPREDYGLAYLLGLGMYGGAFWYGHRIKELFYLSAVPFSGITFLTALALRLGEGVHELMLMLTTLFVMGSIALLVQYLVKLNRRWHEQT
jgi:hypothetical protein